ncbi:MAG: electron transfer flavoprotein subunit alpha [Firmicutes bacterium]|nr:electron transfer flavoprotein subunit alpha [Bacillota bacterium]
MKVITVFKWLRNPQDALVKADGSIEWPGVKMSANDDDPAVMEIAAALASGDEIIALTIGDGDLAWAAARGATRTTVITDALTEVNSSVTGAILAAAVKHLGDAEVIIIGDSSWDYGVVSAFIGQLGRPALAGVTAAQLQEGCIQVTRKLGSVSQVLEVNTPLVLAAMATQSEKNEPSMKQVLTARKKPMEKLTLEELGFSSPFTTVSSLKTRFPDTPPAVLIKGDDPVCACEELMAALHTEGVL